MILFTVEGLFTMFFALIAAHAVCDMPLQGDFLSSLKRPDFAKQFGPRVWLLGIFLHSMIHGGAVLLITGSIWLAVAQVVAHYATDFSKVRGEITFMQDQLLHVLVMAITALCSVSGVI